MLPLLGFGAAVVIWAAGCATSQMRSFNQDYSQNFACAPNYAVENVNDTKFKLVVHQGAPMPGPQRVVYMKQAAAAVAETEAKRRGWQNWDLNYIQEGDRGWMHVLVGEVTRKTPVELAPGAVTNQP